MNKTFLGCLCIVSALFGEELRPVPLSKTCEERPAFLVNADYLYWFVREDGLDLGVQATVETSRTFSTARIKPLYLDFEWNSGLQIGMGTHFANSNRWKIYANE